MRDNPENKTEREGCRPERITRGEIDRWISGLYEPGEVDRQRSRYARAAGEFERIFHRPPLHFVSSPGRTELGGNHTDHNHGRVLAASIGLDKIAAVAPSEEKLVRVFTAAFDSMVEVDISSLEPRGEEEGTSAALVRGIAAFFAEEGHRTGGFAAYVDSEVAMGSGLSSSASFEVLVAGIFNLLYNNNQIDMLELARAGKWAENNYFGKPCGLMDQIACAHGGVVAIDFADTESPVIEGIDFSFAAHGYRLCVLDTGSSHADLTGDYASIPREMGCIASYFSADNLREVDPKYVRSSVPELRERCGNRAVLRALHFYREHERASSMAGALRAGDIASYLALVGASGSSSWRFLQNCIPSTASRDAPAPGKEAGREQGLALALGLSEDLLGGEGFQRVQGGGFAGTIQAYVPHGKIENYRRKMESVFGKGSLTELYIRDRGVVAL